MKCGSLHKLVFAPTPDQLQKLLRKEARSGWLPSKFEAQSTKGGLLLVLEKREREQLGKSA